MKIFSGLIFAAIAVNAVSAGSSTYLRSSESDERPSDLMAADSYDPIQSADKVDDSQIDLKDVLRSSEKTNETKDPIVKKSHVFDLSYLSDSDSNVADGFDSYGGLANTVNGKFSRGYVPWGKTADGPTRHEAGTVKTSSTDFSLDDDCGSNENTLPEDFSFNDGWSTNNDKQSSINSINYAPALSTNPSKLSWLVDSSSGAVGNTLDRDEASTLDSDSGKYYFLWQERPTLDTSKNSYQKNPSADDDCGSNNADIQSLIDMLGKTQTSSDDYTPSSGMLWESDRYSDDANVKRGSQTTGDSIFGGDNQSWGKYEKDSFLSDGLSKDTYLSDSPSVRDSGKEDLIQDKRPLLIKIPSSVDPHNIHTVQSPVLLTHTSSVSSYIWSSAKTDSDVSVDNGSPLIATSYQTSTIGGASGLADTAVDHGLTSANEDGLNFANVKNEMKESTSKLEDNSVTDSKKGNLILLSASRGYAEPKVRQGNALDLDVSPNSPTYLW
ncbi:RxLR-like protein [Plasmopara halstedii]|uniref:RxLR-like protein n=1 Tax=Plasmopara halstedii TaxID=4781 RepID=A0A0P1A861_PLAHL|nr:RxLR-like protein [Plasmopara halstedii]CEG36711.1 RxLR-like protein [Plasmopara halstedii]|eukprot:XP_024573080.1 RxLR-like protein [Plasmopara halstedii]